MQVDLAVRLFRKQRSLDAILGFEHCVAILPEKPCYELANSFLILCQQERFRSTNRRDRTLARLHQLERFVNARQIDLECRASAGFAVYPDETATLLHNSVYRRQPKPRTFALFFGREERLEDVALRFRVHPVAGIAYGKQDILAGLRGGMFAGIRLVHDEILGLDD